jgi:predicted RNA-binding protein (TIGR00451 family)
LKSHTLSKSATNEILDKITSKWHIDIPKIKTLVLHELDEHSSLTTGDNFKALKIDDTYLPFLSETLLLDKFPKVIVDTGAIKFVCNGANIMRPGIKKYSEFKKADIVCVVEESHNKYLAVGKSFVSSDDMQNITKGEVVQNLHYISDKYWETVKLIK